MTGIGVYPGSFNPPTVAHLAIAEAARLAHDLSSIELAISRVALAKETVQLPRFDHRVEAVRASVEDIDWLRVVVTDHQLLADIAADYDVLILGADKWHQIQEQHWYGSRDQRDRALAALPRLAVAPRSGFDVPGDLRLELKGHETVSSTRARSGETALMTPAAAAFADRTGAWIDSARYEHWLSTERPSNI